MNRLLIIISVFIFTACNTTTGDYGFDGTTKVERTYETSYMARDSINDFRHIFVLNQLNDSTIDFNYTVTKTECILILQGEAINKHYNMDMESDEDEEGNAYFVNQYTYKNKDGEFTFRIGVGEDLDKMRVYYDNITKTCLFDIKNGMILTKNGSLK